MGEKIAELKNTIVELIDNLLLRIDSISSDCRETGTADGERLVNLFDDLEALAEGINIIKDLYENINLLELEEKLDIIETAMKSGDAMLLADAMQFELKYLLEAWREDLNVLN